MARNQKLTTVLQGRRISGIRDADNRLTVLFDDGSTMTVRKAGTTNIASRGSIVKGVRQEEMSLSLDFDNGSTMAIPLAEETSSVMVRNKNQELEYAD